MLITAIADTTPFEIACAGTSLCQIARCLDQSTVQNILSWMSCGGPFTDCDACTKGSLPPPVNLNCVPTLDNKEPCHTLTKMCKSLWLESKWQMNLLRLKFLVSFMNIVDILLHWESIVHTFGYSPHNNRIFLNLRESLSLNSKASNLHMVSPSIQRTLLDSSAFYLKVKSRARNC